MTADQQVLSPPAPIEKTHREGRGQNRQKRCPSTRKLVLRDMHGNINIVYANCKSRACPACAPTWINERVDAVGHLTRGHNGWYEAVVLTKPEWPKFKKAMQRARKKGVDVNGIKIPTDIDGTVVVLLARTDDSTICRSAPSTHISDPVIYTRNMLKDASQAAAEANDIPYQYRPEVGQVRGLGEWNGQLTPPGPTEPIHKAEYLGEAGAEMTIDEMKESVKAHGGKLGPPRDDSLLACFANKTAEARWLAHIGLEDDHSPDLKEPFR